MCKSGGGGDGGAAERKAAEDARVAQAVQRINEIFGLSVAKPEEVSRAEFTRQQPISTGYSPIGGNNQQGTYIGFGQYRNPATQSVFDEEGYNRAVAAANAKAAQLNQAASGRNALYKQIGEDAKAYAVSDLDEDRERVARELRFNLARSGLSGGSRDIDANKELLDTYQDGLLEATNIGLSKANSARISDDKTRTNLISSVQAGLDEGSAIQQAYEGMSNNARQARDDANTASLSGFFDTLRNEFNRYEYNKGLEQVSSNPTQRVASSKGYNGTIRSYS